VFNRRVTRLTMVEKDGDYEAFDWVPAESLGRPEAPSLPAY